MKNRIINWIGSLTLSLLLKLAARKLEPLFLLWSFFLLKLVFISLNMSYNLAWNTVCLYELVLLVAIWISRISYRSKYVGLLVICMLLLWNPWLIIEIYSAQVFSIGIILVDGHANWLNCLHFFFLLGEGGAGGGAFIIHYSNRLPGCLVFLWPFLDVNSFSAHATRLTAFLSCRI